MAAYSRQTAIPCTLAEIESGEWQQGANAPSGIRTVRGLISRVSVLGVIIDKALDASILLDDGSATLRVRSFDPQPRTAAYNVGDLVLVIGRPREYNGERYIVLEICKRQERGWIEYRKRELAHFSSFIIEEDVMEQPAAPAAAQTVSVQDAGKNPFELLIDAIRRLDGGQGADVTEVLTQTQHPDGQRLLRALVEEGEVFEIRPGRLKVLE